MALEWAAPVATVCTAVAGVYFTWLTGAQGRRHLERMTQFAETAAMTERSRNERREAYLAVLRMARLDLQRFLYKREAADDKLAAINETWSKGERTRLAMEAFVAVEAFGSPEANAIAGRLQETYLARDEQLFRAAYDEFVELVREELGSTPSRSAR